MRRDTARREGTPRPRRSGNRDFPWNLVLHELEKFYQKRGGRVPFLNVSGRDPFRVLVSTVLSQRTRDEVTHLVSERLFRQYPTPAALAKASRKDLETAIREVGFYRTKAKALKELSHTLEVAYGGRVPKSTEELMRLPMVGPKTAGCVLVYGFGMPALPVDTHVHRISNRLGVVNTRTPEKTEEALRPLVPRKLWALVNPILVQHGQNVCRPIHPLCDKCPITDHCKYFLGA